MSTRGLERLQDRQVGFQVRQGLGPADLLLHLLITQPKREKKNKVKRKAS